MNINKNLIYDTLIAIQGGLFGQVPLCLRAITFEVENSRIKVYFYHDGPISEKDKDLLMIDVQGEIGDILLGMSEIFIEIEKELIHLDPPQPIPKTGYLAYKRYEPGTFTQEDYLFPEHFTHDLESMYGTLIRPLVLIAAQKSLFNRVEDNLQKVATAWDEQTIWLHFYYHDPITELNEQLAQTAANEFKLSFPGNKIIFKILPSSEIKKFLDFYNIVPETNISAIFHR